MVERFTVWARDRADVVGAALVGSHARGEARDDSDVDLMLVTQSPEGYREDTRWLDSFGSTRSVAVEQWGAVTSVRVHYADGTQVEFGITTTAWCATDPLDDGTARVVRDGFRILVDPAGLLAELAAVAAA